MKILRAKKLNCALFALLLLAALFFHTQESVAQIRAGYGHLKILPGARQQNLANSMVAGLDEPYSLYANPAATGFLRNYQFSFSHNRWIADFQSTSFLLAKQLRVNSGLSDRLNLAIGLNYQGLGLLDATGGLAPAADASDLAATLSLGLPLSKWRHNMFSLGGSLKYLRSKLADDSGQTVAADLGLMFRTRRHRISRHWAGIYSLGFSVNNWGKSVKFVNQRTPLPTTLRGGLGINIGRHDGAQFQFLVGYQKPKDEVSSWHVGGEIQHFLALFRNLGLSAPQLERLLSLRAGWNSNSEQNSRLVGKFSIGLSLRLDDYANSNRATHKSAFPPQNSAVRGDMGFMSSSLLRNTSQYSATWFDLKPEGFESEISKHHSSDISRRPDSLYWVDDQVKFAWKPSHDPDLFDQVNYILLLSEDSTVVKSKLAELRAQGLAEMAETWREQRESWKENINESRVTFVYLENAKPHTNGTNGSPGTVDSLTKITGDSYLLNGHKNSFRVNLQAQPDSGSYYWSTVAYDRNLHFNIIKHDDSELARFHVRLRPDFQLKFTNTSYDGKTLLVDVEVKDLNETILDHNPNVLVTMGSSGVVGSFNTSLREHHTFIRRGIEIELPVEHTDIVATVNPPGGDRIPESNYVGNLDVYANNVDSTKTFRPDLSVTKQVRIRPFTPKINFKLSKASLTEADSTELDRVSAALNSSVLDTFFVRIDGHTDKSGWYGLGSEHKRSIQKNCELSGDRVKSTRSYLTGPGSVPTTLNGQPRITTNGFAHFLPVDTASGDTVRANRRVEIRLFHKLCDEKLSQQDCRPIQPQPCSEEKELSLVDSGSEIVYTTTISELEALPTQAFTLVVEVPDNMVTYGYEPMVSDSLVEKGVKKLLWPFSHFDASQTMKVTYRGKYYLNKAGAEKVMTKAALTFGRGRDLRLENNSASVNTYVLGKSASSPSVSPDLSARARHIVKCGETLSQLAIWYYGDWKRYQEIAAANQIANPNLILPGQQLIIPDIDQSTLARVQKQSKAKLPVAKNVEILGTPVVGETLRGQYRFEYDCGVEENSILKWFTGDELRATGLSSYKVQDKDANKEIWFKVTPKAKGGATGMPDSAKAGATNGPDISTIIGEVDSQLIVVEPIDRVPNGRLIATIDSIDVTFAPSSRNGETGIIAEIDSQAIIITPSVSPSNVRRIIAEVDSEMIVINPVSPDN